MTKEEREKAKNLCIEKIDIYFPDGIKDIENQTYTFMFRGAAKFRINLTSQLWENVHNPDYSGQGADNLIAKLNKKKVAEVHQGILSGEGYQDKEMDRGKLYDNRYFEVLGYNRGMYYFLSKEHGQIQDVSYSHFNSGLFHVLAPPAFWKKLNLGDLIKGGDFRFYTNNITAHLISIAKTRGIFNFKRVRCRGAWREDAGNIIINTGKDIIEEDHKIPIEEFKSNFIYEKGSEILFDMTDPLDDETGSKILKIIKRLSFKSSAMAYWLAGWCVVSPFGGALNWRPHIFLTGGSGTGKSTVIKLIINKMLGDFCIQTFGNSSEPSLRRGIAGDSVPVIIDEGEPKKDRMGTAQTQNLIELARISSSEGDNDSGIMRVDGKRVVDYRVRSCWMFAAVIQSLIKRADVTRFSTIELVKGYNGTTWFNFEKEIESVITKEVATRLKSRVIKNYNVIEHNIKSFKHAVSNLFENSRIGDQVGTLLAGAFFLESLKKYDLEEAKALVIEADIKDSLDFLDFSHDEIKCFDMIMQFMLKPLDDMTIISALNKYEYSIINKDRDTVRRIKKVLEPYGIDLREIKGTRYLFIMVGNTHIDNILKYTDFKNYDRILERLDFCRERRGGVRFGDLGKKTALVFHPEAVLNDEYEE